MVRVLRGKKGSATLNFLRRHQFSSTMSRDLYASFVTSTERSDLLLQKLNCGQKVVKRASRTRWSSHHNACSASGKSWKEFMETLNFIENDTPKKLEVLEGN